MESHIQLVELELKNLDWLIKDMNIDSLYDFLKPYLRIFLSIDVVGSTQFKQNISQIKNIKNEEELNEPWLDAILEFYHQVSSIFFQTWENYSDKADKNYNWDSGEKPKLWKAVGDELIFTKKISDHRQAYVCVAALIDTAKNCRKKLQKHSNNINLKCTAWIAGFPVNNKEVLLNKDFSKNTDVGDYIYENMNRLKNKDENKGENFLEDYIGPSIDTGFRLGAFSSSRKCILSVDLAYLLSHVSGNLTNVSPQLKHFTYFYEGKHVLKGVNNGKPYPIFWIDTSDEDNQMIKWEDKLENRLPIPHSDVKGFCEHFLEQNKDTHIMRPYIITDKHDIFSNIPDHHKKQIEKLFNYYNKESERINNERDAALSVVNNDDAQSVNIETFIAEILKLAGNQKN